MKYLISKVTILVCIMILTLSFTTNSNNVVLDEKEAVVSYYGKQFHGRLTASGEVFDMNAMTCAHKTLKFGTKVKFTNPRNGKSVVAKVNDRGPFIKGRTFDLSKGAFDAIANTNRGVVKLKYQIID